MHAQITDLMGVFEFKSQKLNKQDAIIMTTFVLNFLWHQLIETRCRTVQKPA